jgi:hypothetical protein
MAHTSRYANVQFLPDMPRNLSLSILFQYRCNLSGIPHHARPVRAELAHYLSACFRWLPRALCSLDRPLHVARIFQNIYYYCLRVLEACNNQITLYPYAFATFTPVHSRREQIS